ncbi:MAG: hypothetical protein AB7F86_15100 [Bdellovibrionales bacterium]
MTTRRQVPFILVLMSVAVLFFGMSAAHAHKGCEAPLGEIQTLQSSLKPKKKLMRYWGEHSGFHPMGWVFRFSEESAAKRQVFIRNGLLYGSNGLLFNTSYVSGLSLLWDFVVDDQGRLFVLEPLALAGVARVHHSSFPFPVVFAGGISVLNGRVIRIDNNSGHFRPTGRELYSIIQSFRAAGVKIPDNGIEVVSRYRGQRLRRK